MSKSLFEIGTKAEYEALTVKDEDVMYWITDTQELYKGEVRYAVGKEATDEEAGLMSAEDKSFIESLKDLVDNGVIGANISIDSGAEISNYGLSRNNNITIEDDANELNTLTTSTPMLMSLRSTPKLMNLDSLNDDGIIIDDEGNKWLIDNDGNRWLIDDKYPWYDCYKDESYSHIDSNKNIIIDNGQINITNEANAQFIPFEMKRHYDGVDLSKMIISLIYVTQDGYNGKAEIVNMQYGEDTIRFAWLIDEKVTHIAGSIRFEV